MAAVVRYSAEAGIARLVLDSPHNRNALSSALIEQLLAGLDRAAGDSSVRCIVLGHEGGTFCAGADLSEATNGDPGVAAVGRALEMAKVLRAVIDAPVPVIGAIDGHVRAGGLGLVGACDVVVAGPRSTFALTEARIGVAPSIISLTLLPKMSARAAGRYFVSGETFGAAEAAAIGVVTMAADDVEARVAELATEIAKGSPQGLAASKELTTAALRAAFDREADVLARQSAELFTSDEAREGMMAFLEKRPARWVP
jgi:enoyl-CoA hydratase